MVSIAVLAVFGGVNAAEPARGGRSGMMGNTVVNASRMPTMPTTGLTTIGNPAVTTTSTPAEVVAAQQVVPTPTPTPNPDPKPDPEPDPKPVLECEDGGVKNSDYTINMCMEDLRRCIDTGGLQGGVSDLYNEDVRNSVFTGMRLCQNAVDKCIANVRVNCRNVYNENNDVWLDFNSRVIQPDYYNFVLRKTGLTPYQAENTCLLLDRNTFGSAFTSVSDIDVVRAEYKKKVGAYNGAYGKSLSKDNPLGVEVNTTGYDGQRGHYARWDAANAECLLRVGAYNKNTQIKNSWLFGGVGNDNVAEVWKPAGSQFTCNKDLFGFSLLNDTKTAAVVGIAGGAVVGAGVGAGIGAAVYDSKKKAADEAATVDHCADEAYRSKMGAKIMNDGYNLVLTNYLDSDAEGAADGTFTKTRLNEIDAKYDYRNMSEEVCNKIHNLYAVANLYEQQIKSCLAKKENKKIAEEIFRLAGGKTQNLNMSLSFNSTVIKSAKINGEVKCEPCSDFAKDCMFVPLERGFVGDSIMCTKSEGCAGVHYVQYQVDELRKFLAKLEPVVAKSVKNKKSKTPSKGATIGKGAAIGAATGVGAGGLATAITAFVERSNITCKVGDGLNSVALGKSHVIDTLRDFL